MLLLMPRNCERDVTQREYLIVSIANSVVRVIKITDPIEDIGARARIAPGRADINCNQLLISAPQTAEKEIVSNAIVVSDTCIKGTVINSATNSTSEN